MNRRRGANTFGVSLMAIIVGALLIYAGVYRNHSQATGTENTFRVIKVADGDTIVVDWNGQKRTIRLIGMDTPEVVDPRKTVQCFGREASNRAHELLENKTVKIETDPLVGEVDKYGRTLGYVFLPDGTLYNKALISDGYANEYTYNKQTYKYQAEFKLAEAEAQAAQRGLWNPNTCNGDTKQPA